MNTTPLWVPLVVALIGVLGTITAGIAGVLITQRRSDKREDKAWERERERERERWAREDKVQRQRWAREDQAQLFEHRREVYADFYESLRAMAKRVYDHGYGFTDEPELPFDWNFSTYQKLQRLELYADRLVADAASQAYSAAWTWGTHTKHDDPDHADFHVYQERYDQLEPALLTAIRQGLSISNADLTEPDYRHRFASAE